MKKQELFFLGFLFSQHSSVSVNDIEPSDDKTGNVKQLLGWTSRYADLCKYCRSKQKCFKYSICNRISAVDLRNQFNF